MDVLKKESHLELLWIKIFPYVIVWLNNSKMHSMKILSAVNTEA